MNKYYQIFKTKRYTGEELVTPDLSTTTIEDRAWLLATYAYAFYITKDKYNTAVCIDKFQMIALNISRINKIASIGEEYLDEEDKQYNIVFTDNVFDKRILKIDQWLTGFDALQVKKFLAIIGGIIAGIVSFLFMYYILKQPLIPSGCVGAILLLLISIALPILLKESHIRMMSKKVFEGNPVLKDSFLYQLLHYDDKLASIAEKEKYKPFLNAKNDFEISEAIRKFPK